MLKKRRNGRAGRHDIHVNEQRMSDHVSQSVHVPLHPDRAFALFAEQLGHWWPQEYTWSRKVLELIGIEPRVDGLCFEHGPHGFRCDWGRVLAWELGR